MTNKGIQEGKARVFRMTNESAQDDKQGCSELDADVVARAIGSWVFRKAKRG